MTPPVALESFAASGIAGSSPMKTAFTSWKLAKGLYILPIIMAYHPLLLNGPTGAVVLTVILSTLAIISFVACMERYFLTNMSWPETILHGATAVMLIWNIRLLNIFGIILFVLLVIFQILKRRRNPGREISRRV
ncbi:TRAP-type uncharacterized transport system, fused permease component [Olavius sp. associated proteobacterium Delta 1]|nr:TRAP-type uncharacterized transport system, fused permease component [Olavius sp. associated proteobacterium Delta 1]